MKEFSDQPSYRVKKQLGLDHLSAIETVLNPSCSIPVKKIGRHKDFNNPY
jgi:hypothetical protein